MATQFPKHELDRAFKELFEDWYGSNALTYIRIGWTEAAKFMFNEMNKNNAYDRNKQL